MSRLIKVLDKDNLPAVHGELSSISDAGIARVSEDIRNPGRPMRWGVWLLLLGLCGFLVWGMLAPLDEGVPASALITVDSKRQTVQHLTGGIVKEILAREAAAVSAGDVVMRLEDTVAIANDQAARQQYMALRATESRLEAERKNATEVIFHADLAAAKDDPVVSEHMNLQRQLFASRRQAMQGEQAILQQTLASTKDLLNGYQAQLEGKQAQLKLVREQLQGTRDLVKEGYLPRNRLFDEERLAADLAASVGEITASIAKTKSTMLELQMRLTQVRNLFTRDVETQLAETTRDAKIALERWRLSQDELSRTQIRSPADGFVVGLAAHTVGGVIPPGARIMDVVPSGSLLTFEARVEPHLIDRVRPDLPVDIRVSAFIDDPNLVLRGRLLSVSADLLGGESEKIPPYYLARVVVTPEGMKELGKRQLQPGMPAEVIIKTGERTFFQYLIAPIIRRVATAFREV